MKKLPRYNLLALLSLLGFGIATSMAQIQGQDRIDSLIGELRIVHSDTTKVNLLNSLASEYSTANSDTALKFANQALDISGKMNWQIGIGKSYHRMAAINYDNGNYKAALPFYLKSLDVWELLEKSNSEKLKTFAKSEKAKVFINVGAMYNALGNNRNALNYYDSGIRAFEEQGNKQKIAEGLVNKGIVYSEQGIYSESIKNYLIALKMFEELDYKRGISFASGNIGIIYEAQGNYANALTYYYKSLRVSEEIGDKASVASDLTNIAIVYVDQKNYPLALEYNSKAFDVAEDAGEKNLSAIIINNRGEIYEKIDELSKAHDCFSKALIMFEEIENKSGIASALGNIGLILFKEKKYAKAETFMLRSLYIFDSTNALNEIMKTNNNLSELYSKTNNYQKALIHFQKAIMAKDSLFSNERTKEITRLEMGYEQQKKDAIVKADISRQKMFRNLVIVIAAFIIVFSLLFFLFYTKRRNVVQKQKETTLQLQVSETEMKALRSQMNPHFIFNALQSIKTFLAKHQAEEANTYLFKFGRLMRAVLENSQKSEVSLQNDKEALELYMQLETIRLNYPFTYQFHIDETVDMEETTIPPLILQPFVENAIWHGLQPKSGPGHIDITISQKSDVLYASVIDNGVGRDISKKTRPFSLAKKESLGMKLTEGRLKILNEVKKINAYFTITDLYTDDNQPAGTKVELFIPVIHD